MPKLILSFTISLFFLSLGALLSPVLAADFDVFVDRVFTVNDTTGIVVEETHRVRNNTSTFVIPGGNLEKFHVSIIGDNVDELNTILASAKAYFNGSEVTFTTELKDGYAEIHVRYPRDLRTQEQFEFKVTYQNTGLIETKGALVDIYAPGFAKDIKFTDGSIQTIFTNTVRVAKSLPEVNFVAPTETGFTEDDNYATYVFSQESLIGTTLWIQLGKVQHYGFVITQVAPATESKQTGHFNEYRVVLPRDIDELEMSQRVYFESFSPEPIQVLSDDDGNLIGYFKFPSHESGEIVVKGYASLSSTDVNLDQNNSGLLSDIVLDPIYTADAKYWEVNSSEIQTLANELKTDKTNVYELIRDTYSHVVETIDYSQVKRFGINERQGALATLQGGAAVCMEYSDLFLTLLRAEGIPARAVFGYGYDSKLEVTEQEPHQWVQIYIPGSQTWASADVTWGESGPALIGGDLNHFYTHVSSADPNTPASVERISYGDESELAVPDFAIEAYADMPDTSAMLSAAAVQAKYPEVTSMGFFTDFLADIKTRLGGNEGNTISGIALIGVGAVMIVATAIAAVVMLRKEQRHRK